MDRDVRLAELEATLGASRAEHNVIALQHKETAATVGVLENERAMAAKEHGIERGKMLQAHAATLEQHGTERDEVLEAHAAALEQHGVAAEETLSMAQRRHADELAKLNGTIAEMRAWTTGGGMFAVQERQREEREQHDLLIEAHIIALRDRDAQHAAEMEDSLQRVAELKRTVAAVRAERGLTADGAVGRELEVQRARHEDALAKIHLVHACELDQIRAESSTSARTVEHCKYLQAHVNALNDALATADIRCSVLEKNIDKRDAAAAHKTRLTEYENAIVGIAERTLLTSRTTQPPLRHYRNASSVTIALSPPPSSSVAASRWSPPARSRWSAPSLRSPPLAQLPSPYHSPPESIHLSRSASIENARRSLALRQGR